MTSRTGNRDGGGFTLIELSFITVVLVVLLAAAIPSFRGAARRLQVERATVDLMQLLRYAREQSVVQGRPVAWTWDATARRARLALQDPLNGQRTPLTDSHAVSRAVPSALAVSLSRRDAPSDEVLFFPDGTSEPARLVVSNERTSYTVAVDGGTGQVALLPGAAPR